MRRRIVLAALLPMLAALCGGQDRPAASTRPSEPVARLTLLHINDTHGQMQSHESNGRSVGGYPRLASLLGRVRAEANQVLFLHAGDELSRGDPLTRRTRGSANVELLNRLGLDAWTPGNGDFYEGTDNLQALAGQARFALLTANVKLRSTGKPLGREWITLQAGPVKVALFGLCTVYPDEAGGLELADPIQTAQRIVPELRQQADVVVAVSHLGYLLDFVLARRVAGIDVIVGGHSHTVLDGGRSFQGPDGRPVLIVQAGSGLEYLGRVDLELRPAQGRWQVQSAKARLLPLEATVPEDAGVKALLARLSAASRPAPVGAGR